MEKSMKLLLAVTTSLIAVTACAADDNKGKKKGGGLDKTSLTTSVANTEGSVEFKMDAWADNWFAAYMGEALIVEDSVPITTERSFNAETVTFKGDYPLQLNFILKDFKENDTGLEYIGSRKQQMGDGGFIMQLKETASNKIVAVSDSSWACTVIHQGPLDKSCAKSSDPVAGTSPCDFNKTSEPASWKEASFDDSGWKATTLHSADAVDPKQGYDKITWDPSAKIIWGPDLETDNTLLCRVTVNK